MPNSALHDAMSEARVSQKALAAACGVDAKTVQRWIADDTRIPRRDHRWKVAETLGVDDTMIWPKKMRTLIKSGADKEIVSAFPYRSNIPKSLWHALIAEATTEMTFAGYTNYFLWLEQANFRRTLERKAEAGCRVRFIVGEPDSDTTRAREEREGVALTVSTRIRITLDELGKIDHANVSARFSDDHLAMSVFRFDDDMIVTPHLAALVGHDSPALHLSRYQDDGMFDRFAAHVEYLWEGGRPVVK